MKKKIYVAIAMLLCSSGFAQIPQLLSHQGYIADSAGNGITNTLPMTFRMFNDSTGGSAILTQSYPGVSLTKGIFNVNLDVSSLSFNSQYWLETEVNGQTLSPRTRLTSAPYSLAPWATNGTDVYYNNGKVGIGTTNPGANLSFGNSTAARKIALFENSGGNNIYGLGFDPSNYSTSLLVNGTQRLFIPIFGDFPNYAHVWGLTVGYGTGTAAITTDTFKPISLQIFGSEKMRIAADGNVGIGTNNPEAKLDVAGNVKIADGTQGAGKVLTSDANGVASWATPSVAGASGFTDDGAVVRLTTLTDNVGIGTTSPGSILDVRRPDNSAGDAIAFGTQGYFMGRLGEDASTNMVYLSNTYGDPASDGAGIQFRLGSNSGGTSGFPRMTILNKGNVGIGTEAPVSRLEVKTDAAGTIGPVMTLTNGGTGAGTGSSIDSYNPNLSGNTKQNARVQFLGDGAGSADISFWTKNVGADALNERLRISSNGNVGIGGTGFKLTVAETATPAANGTVMYVVSNNSTGAVSHSALRVDNTATNNLGIGIKGTHFGGGFGVFGLANTGYGIVGQATGAGGLAGKFVGNVDVTGTLSKGSGTFKIDHPLDPEHKYLYHSFVESPDMMNIYNGNIITDSRGEATVTLPSYFEALNRDFRYQLTVVGQFAQAIVAEKIRGNTFKIKTDKPDVEVSWQVTGVRKDVFANAHRVVPEVPKTGNEIGKYVHPVELGKPKSMSIDQLLGETNETAFENK